MGGYSFKEGTEKVKLKQTRGRERVRLTTPGENHSSLEGTARAKALGRVLVCSRNSKKASRTRQAFISCSFIHSFIHAFNKYYACISLPGTEW